MRTEHVGYVNLTSGTVKVREIPDELARQYLGGRGINAYLLYHHSEKGMDPLSQQSPLIVGAGLLSGYLAHSAGRVHFTGKSPETGIYGDSNMGGTIGSELKYAGFQHLVITGQADKPVYLWVHDGQIEIKDASKLWGADTYDTQVRIHDELGDPDTAVACIGVAGEKLIPFACVRHLMKKAAGRTGLGCLMGSKRLKAIAVRGHQGLKPTNPDKLLETFNKQYTYLRKTKIFSIASVLGNLFAWVVNSEGEHLSVRNFQQTYFPEALGKLDIDIFMREYADKHLACHGCALHCQHKWSIKEGPYAGVRGEGPDWGPGWLLGGTVVGNNRIDVSLVANELTNKYGVDCISYFSYIGWLMELWQRGIINEKDTGGLDFSWGSPEAIIGTFEQLISREGAGGLLSEGSDAAVGKIGKDCDRYLHRDGKGQTEEGLDHRGWRATALGCHTSARGNCHLRGLVNLEHMFLPADFLEKVFWRRIDPDPYSWETKAWMAIWIQHLCAVSDASGQCKFLTKWYSPDLFGFEEILESINDVTDWNMTRDELFEAGERTFNVERLFNAREGLGRLGDIPPAVFFQPTPEGPKKGLVLDKKKYGEMLDEYYDIRGWDREGRPLPETLKRLDLDKEPQL
jgi:aldehyde:ferredoxin oxidoreductase